MTVAEAVEDGDHAAALKAMALSLADAMDGPSSATSKSMCARALMDALSQLRELAPPEKREDRVDEVAKRRRDRISSRAAH